MQMDEDQKFMITWLEEKVLDVAEQDVYIGNTHQVMKCLTNEHLPSF